MVTYCHLGLFEWHIKGRESQVSCLNLVKKSPLPGGFALYFFWSTIDIIALRNLVPILYFLKSCDFLFRFCLILATDVWTMNWDHMDLTSCSVKLHSCLDSCCLIQNVILMSSFFLLFSWYICSLHTLLEF